MASSLSRGTWIEIRRGLGFSAVVVSSLSRGTWIEMVVSYAGYSDYECRPSHEGRGLKLKDLEVEV